MQTRTHVLTRCALAVLVVAGTVAACQCQGDCPGVFGTQMTNDDRALLMAASGAAPPGLFWSHLISSEVSSYNSECQPWVAETGKRLYFIMIDCNGPARPGHQGGWDIYVAAWDSVNRCWLEPVNLGPNVNSSAGERGPSATPDGDTLFFARGGDIFVSFHQGDTWTVAERLPGPVNTPSGDKDPAISFDRQRLYFASDRAGLGDFDIYVVRRAGTIMQWDSLTNIGPNVNTLYNEVRPFESADRSELLFTDFSDDTGVTRPGSFGGVDLWISGWTDSGWGVPRNAGAPLNNDRTLCSAWMNAQMTVLYGGSESFEGSRGEEDIWVAYRDSAPVPAQVSDTSVNWQLLGELDGAWNIYALDEGQGGELYAGTSSTLYPDAGTRGVVYKTTNRGTSWTATETLPGAMVVHALLAASDGSVYAGTYPNGDVFRSTDGGTSWAATADLPGASTVRVLVESWNHRILAGTSPTYGDSGYVFQSTNAGTSWTCLRPMPGMTNGIFSMFEASDSSLLVGGWARPQRIYRTTNGGNTWSALNGFPPPHNRQLCAHGITQTGDGALWVTGWLHAYAGYIFKSTDGGTSWDSTARIFNGPVRAVRIYCLVEDANGNLLAGYQPGPDSVVVMSTDRGATWRRAGTLSCAREVLCLMRASDGSIYAGTTPNGDVFKYVPSGIGEAAGSGLRTANLGPTIAGNVLTLGRQLSADCRRPELLDVAGRTVLSLRPGANDVSHLPSGVYFVRHAQAQAQAQAVRKVVLTR